MILTTRKIESIIQIIQQKADVKEINLHSVPEDKIDDILNDELKSLNLSITSEDFKNLRNEFEYKYQIQQKEGTSIVDDYYEHRDWYSIKCEQEGFDEFFWKRYCCLS